VLFYLLQVNEAINFVNCGLAGLENEEK